MKGLNGKDLEGRQLRVEYGRNRGGGGGGGGGGYRGVSRYDSGRGIWHGLHAYTLDVLWALQCDALAQVAPAKSENALTRQ